MTSVELKNVVGLKPNGMVDVSSDDVSEHSMYIIDICDDEATICYCHSLDEAKPLVREYTDIPLP